MLLNATMVIMLMTNMVAMFMINSHFSNIENQILFNVDLARQQMITELGYLYMKGCQKGAEEYGQGHDKKYVVGFDVNSPTNFCYEARLLQEEYIMEQVARMGKKQQ